MGHRNSKILRKDTNSKSKTQDSTLPPYEPIAKNSKVLGDNERTAPYKGLQIKSTDAPQWEWSVFQCRAWIYAVCVHKFGEAEKQANKFRGCGPLLYRRGDEHWNIFFDNRDDAASFTSLIFAARKAKGSMPAVVTFVQYETTKTLYMESA